MRARHGTDAVDRLSLASKKLRSFIECTVPALLRLSSTRNNPPPSPSASRTSCETQSFPMLESHHGSSNERRKNPQFPSNGFGQIVPARGRRQLRDPPCLHPVQQYVSRPP